MKLSLHPIAYGRGTNTMNQPFSNCANIHGLSMAPARNLMLFIVWAHSKLNLEEYENKSLVNNLVWTKGSTK